MREFDVKLNKHIDLLIERYPSLKVCREDIIKGYLLMEEAYEKGHKLLIAGNGGSAADSEHIAGELMKGLKPHVRFLQNLQGNFVRLILTADRLWERILNAD